MLFHDGVIPQNIELVTKPQLEIKTQDKIIEIVLEITLILISLEYILKTNPLTYD
ncbi:hypothetical protein YN1HA_16820 [Sulfurisphaera ohwakuensis]